MAVQLINIGNVANDGTGDDLREAMIKINQNFEELDLRDDEQTTGTNLGFGEDVFKQKVNYDLEFKTLLAGTDVTITSNEVSLEISADGGIKSLNLESDVNNIDLNEQASLHIAGGQDISTTIIDGIMYISYTGPTEVADDTSPTLGGNLNADSNNISDVATLTANSIVGDVTGLVHGIDIRTLSVQSLDLGNIQLNVTSTFDLFLATNDVDYGTVLAPAVFDSEFGSFV